MRVVYFGTPDFAVESLDAIMQSPRHEVVAVVTVPDRQAGRGQKVVFSPVKQYALDHDLPLLQPEKLRDEDFIEALRACNADMFVVVAFRLTAPSTSTPRCCLAIAAPPLSTGPSSTVSTKLASPHSC